MVIEKFSDLTKVKDNTVVDLSKLEPSQRRQAISFLSGLTYKGGNLKKIACHKFLVRIEE